MRHNHSRRAARGRIQVEANVVISERNDPKYSRRNRFPRADFVQKYPATRSRLDESDCHRSSRFRRSVPCQGHGRQQAWNYVDRLQGRRWHHGNDGSLQFQKWRRLPGNVQHRRFDCIVRAFFIPR